MFGRTLKASIAKDNGRSTEFIRHKYYPDKSLCYECGEEGHLSYKCTRNLLGDREPPPKKVRKRKKPDEKKNDCSYYDSSDDGIRDDETLSAAIAQEQEKQEIEQYRYKVATGEYDTVSEVAPQKRIKKSTYFSDEEDSD